AITFTGGANTLSFGPGATFVGNIGVAGTLDFSQPVDVTLANNITGSGSIGKSDVGTLTLTGNNSYGGSTTVDPGTPLVGRSTAPPVFRPTHCPRPNG